MNEHLPENSKRIDRAFFVHPHWARRGIGRSILQACEQAILDAGFHKVDIVATLAGEPLYASFGYAVVERYDIPLTGSPDLPVVRMKKMPAYDERRSGILASSRWKIPDSRPGMWAPLLVDP